MLNGIWCTETFDGWSTEDHAREMLVLRRKFHALKQLYVGASMALA